MFLLIQALLGLFFYLFYRQNTLLIPEIKINKLESLELFPEYFQNSFPSFLILTFIITLTAKKNKTIQQYLKQASFSFNY